MLFLKNGNTSRVFAKILYIYSLFCNNIQAAPENAGFLRFFAVFSRFVHNPTQTVNKRWCYNCRTRYKQMRGKGEMPSGIRYYGIIYG